MDSLSFMVSKNVDRIPKPYPGPLSRADSSSLVFRFNTHPYWTADGRRKIDSSTLESCRTAIFLFCYEQRKSDWYKEVESGEHLHFISVSLPQVHTCWDRHPISSEFSVQEACDVHWLSISWRNLLFLQKMYNVPSPAAAWTPAMVLDEVRLECKWPN